MDYSILIVSMCIEESTRIKRLKTEDFLTKMPQKPGLSFLGTNGQKSIWLQVQENGAKKSENAVISENGGERKINPSTNPD